MLQSCKYHSAKLIDTKNKVMMHQVMGQPRQHSLTCNINKNVTLFAKLSESEYLNFSCNLVSEREMQGMTSILKPLAKDTKLYDIKAIIHSLLNYTTINYLRKCGNNTI